MKIKTTLIVMGMLLPMLSVKAQTIKPLSVGDKVHDLVLHNVINGKDSTVKLSDFKKPVILDFFATWCGSCIAALGHLNKLQQAFKDSIQIIVICYETQQKIQALLAKKKKEQYSHLLFVTEDSTLQEFFPHYILPHELWLDKDLHYYTATDASSITAFNLQKWLSNQRLSLDKKTDKMDFDMQKSLYEQVSQQNKDVIIQRSTFTKHIEGLPGISGIRKDSFSHNTRFYFYNTPAIRLIQTALSFPYKNRIIIDSAIRGKFIGNMKDGNWFRRHSYCYEIILTDTDSSSSFHSLMLHDLCGYLHIQTKVECIETPCLRLVYTQNEHRKLHKTIDTVYSVLKENPTDGIYHDYHNWPSAKIASILDQYTSIPVLDGTVDSVISELRIHKDNLEDLTKLRTELRSQGLDLVPSKTKLPMLSISPENTQHAF